jgi:hypothetical protein
MPSVDLNTKVFVHRRNDDGTCDSICIICYRTVATAVDESALTVAEDRHVCRTEDLNRLAK